MLNECYDLLQALKTAGIELPSYQQGVVTPGKGTGPCLRVRLQQDSSISSIEALSDEEWSGLWTIMDGNQNSRPVVRLNVPLLQIPLEDSWWNSIGYTDKQKRENIPEIDKMNALKIALDKPDWSQLFTIPSGDENRGGKKTPAEKASDLWTRVQDKTKELSASLSSANSLVDVQSVFERFGKLPDLQGFSALLRSTIKAKIESGNLPIDLVETLLVGKLKRNEGKWEASEVKVQFAFDSINGTIYRKKTRTAMETALEAQNSSTAESNLPSESIVRCAYGSEGPLQNSAFPNPRLPIVAEKGIPLVSMFSEAPANTRYGLTDSTIVPVGQMLASQIAKALRWATSDEREGKTWRGVASGIFYKSREQRDLLITYVNGKPEINAAIADFFGEDQDSVNKQFEVDSEIVCDALSAIARELPSSILRVLLLRQVSPGQVQVVFSRALDLLRIVEGARLWNMGAVNLPPIFVPLPIEKGKAPEEGCPKSPYPDQIVRLLSRQWIREGAKKDKQEPFMPVTGPSLGSVINLLIRDPSKYESVVYDLLRRSLIQVGPLLGGLAGAIRTNEKKRTDQYTLENRYQALTTCSTIGLLLHALNSRKEDYMQNSVFAIGKMLALSDDIHRSYCEVVRDGSIPPSLLGNSLLSTAMENPTRAVAVLGDRLKIYIGWAKTAKEPQGTDKDAVKKQIAIRTARKRVDQYGPIAKLVADLGLPAKMDDVAKAHLMLGYLASTKEN